MFQLGRQLWMACAAQQLIGLIDTNSKPWLVASHAAHLLHLLLGLLPLHQPLQGILRIIKPLLPVPVEAAPVDVQRKAVSATLCIQDNKLCTLASAAVGASASSRPLAVHTQVLSPLLRRARYIYGRGPID